MFGNVFTSDSFGAIAITNALNLMETPSTEMDRWFNWNVDYSLLPSVAVDHEVGRMYVLDSIADDAPLPAAKRGERGTYKIDIPRFGERETLLNRSLMGVRDTGTTNLKVIEAERDKALMKIKRRAAHTLGFIKAKLMDGKIYDGSGKLLADFFVTQEQGGQIVIDLDLTVAGVDVNEELVLLKQIAQYVLNETDMSPRGWKLVCGQRANAFLRTDESVKEAMTDVTNVAFLRQDNRDGIMMASNVNIVSLDREYRGVGFINEGNDPQYGVAFLVPEIDDFFNVIFGPSGIEDFLGNPMEFYGLSKLRDARDGVEMFGETYQIAFALLQRAIIKVRIKGTPRANDKLAELIAARQARNEAIDAGDEVPA